MSESQQTGTDYERGQFEDEIELMDYLRVIWRWKYLIAAGTLICAVVAGVISFRMPKVYGISMVLQPGIVKIDDDGKNIYIDSAENIKAIIEAGALDREILIDIVESNNNRPSKSLNLKVNIPKNSHALKVSYETSGVDGGLQILANLGQLLLKKYSERVVHFQNEYEMQIDFKKTEVVYSEARIQASERHIKNIQKRIGELSAQIELFNKNTNSLIQERDKFLSNDTDDSKVLMALLYANAIQQKIALENTSGQEIDKYTTRREDEKLKLDKLKGQLRRLSEEIKHLELKKNNIQNLQILQPPTRSPHPIKPKMKLNVMLAGVAGLFAMLFLAFFLEYIQKHKGELRS
ncbi:MAG: Wzz/FepE/Etk N-terminal domain-containing protein [Planctomycetota bacterium]|jgi:capsular polysaccharide biosynthesis protein